MKEDTYYSRNRDKKLAYAKKYYEEHREEWKLRNQSYARDNPIRRLLFSARISASKRGWEYSITADDIVIPSRCPLLGIELTNIQGKGKIDTNISLDRIDSTKGYIPGNVWVISLLANRMKQNATVEQLRTFAENILKIL